ncbi:MAG: hypothetical protein GXZ07_11665 [Firmicutes bacterium]|nr:hypothetical protein [Bacillota bacterium]
MPSSSRILRGLAIKGWRTYYPRQEENEILAQEKEESSSPDELPEPEPPLPTREEIEEERKAILQQARREGEEQRRRILSEAQEEAVKLAEQARQEGYAKGYREGKTAAEKIKAEADELLEQAHQQREKILADAEPQILQIAVSLAEKLLNYELEVNENLIIGIVSRCLEALPGGREVIVRVNPRDEIVCRENADMLRRLLKKGAVLEIRGDAEVQPGCCKVDSEESEITFDLARELQILTGKLLELAESSGEAYVKDSPVAVQI